MKKVTTTAETLHRITWAVLALFAALLLFALTSCVSDPYRFIIRECHLKRVDMTVTWCKENETP